MRWPAPNRWLRSRCSRTIVESSFCGGDGAVARLAAAYRQVSQLPQAVESWPK